MRTPAERFLQQAWERIIAATIAEVGANGYRNTRVADICRRAKCARSTFYKVYPSRNGAFRAAVEWVWLRALDAIDDDPLGAIVSFVETNPDDARVLLIELPMAMPDEHDRRIELAAERLGGGDLALMLVGGVEAILRKAILDGIRPDLEGLRAFVTPHFAVGLSP